MAYGAPRVPGPTRALTLLGGAFSRATRDDAAWPRGEGEPPPWDRIAALVTDDPHFDETGAPIARPFTVEVGEPRDGVALIVLEGEMDMAAIRAFRSGVEAAIGDREIRTLILDMAEVPFMDSSMLRELLRLNQELRQRGAWPVLAGLQSPVRRLLDLTRTAELFRLAETREAALRRATGG